MRAFMEYNLSINGQLSKIIINNKIIIIIIIKTNNFLYGGHPNGTS